MRYWQNGTPNADAGQNMGGMRFWLNGVDYSTIFPPATPTIAITQLQLGGWGGGRYGSFAGKPSTAGGIQFFVFCPDDLGSYFST